jgi:hypothetical protein
MLEADPTTPALDEAVAARLSAAFAGGSDAGLAQLGAGEVGRSLPPAFLKWRALGQAVAQAGSDLQGWLKKPVGPDRARQGARRRNGRFGPNLKVP